WGLADFYRPNQDFNLRVASRYYKPPEILLGYRKYDYSFDMWSIFRREVFFQGEDDVDQLRAIVRVLGGDDLRSYVLKYSITLAPEPVQSIVNNSTHQRIPLYEFVGWNNGDLAREDALDLVDKLLRYDHHSRLTADEALAHPFFDGVELIDVNTDDISRPHSPPPAEVTQEEEEEE
ncbi:Casein kinase II subunit alpha', partial [Phlyctochytrium bullatum]